MIIKINQELCTGCGVCTDACTRGAIHLVDSHAEIEERLCTECQACLEVCPTEAITAVPEPVSIMPAMVLPVAETKTALVSTPGMAPEKATPGSGWTALAGAVLAFLQSDVAPRIVDLMTNPTERRVASPRMLPASAPTTFSRKVVAQNRGRRKKIRYRGGCVGNGYHKGRR